MTIQDGQLSFAIKETIFLSSDKAGIDEWKELELVPDVEVLETDSAISITGCLQLLGKYKPVKEVSDSSETSSETLVEAVTFSPFRPGGSEEHLYQQEEELSHRIPLNITIPLNRIADIEDIYAVIDSLDYQLQSSHQLLIEADLIIAGIRIADNHHTADAEPASFSEQAENEGANKQESDPDEWEFAHEAQTQTEALVQPISLEEIEKKLAELESEMTRQIQQEPDQKPAQEAAQLLREGSESPSGFAAMFDTFGSKPIASQPAHHDYSGFGDVTDEVYLEEQPVISHDESEQMMEEVSWKEEQHSLFEGYFPESEAKAKLDVEKNLAASNQEQPASAKVGESSQWEQPESSKGEESPQWEQPVSARVEESPQWEQPVSGKGEESSQSEQPVSAKVEESPQSEQPVFSPVKVSSQVKESASVKAEELRDVAVVESSAAGNATREEDQLEAVHADTSPEPAASSSEQQAAEPVSEPAVDLAAVEATAEVTESASVQTEEVSEQTEATDEAETGEVDQEVLAEGTIEEAAEEKEVRVAISGKASRQEEEKVNLTSIFSQATRVKKEEKTEAESSSASRKGGFEADNASIETMQNLTSFVQSKEEKKSRLKLCIIQRDETLETISQRYSLSPSRILEVNNLRSDQIVPGQIIYIPQ
ncbi:LysM peptidoglycan-binding domain-containing protein [Brevibacillus ruminantium]|uniref:LysM peptidoglycan-binding domain-containing protein n=1 Tax=Brevibacillus ruminantium TaxID=2950604 RepID=A0ABY4WB76_9BACL|nr:LysM peptidoglycan-binding domain-containing protein [Brevibacillus ruminantium]USG64149.1 LysM peptidoglycan-binding domain-containing protein [Brevibacillus ruminantium]